MTSSLAISRAHDLAASQCGNAFPDPQQLSQCYIGVREATLTREGAPHVPNLLQTPAAQWGYKQFMKEYPEAVTYTVASAGGCN